MLNRITAFLPLPGVRPMFILASLTTVLAASPLLAQGNPVKFVAPPTIAGGSIPGAYRAFAGKFNRDGRLDVAFGGFHPFPFDTSFSQLALNQGGGTFTAVNSGAGRSADQPGGADAGADMNGDGITDFLTMDSPGIRIQLSAGDGTISNEIDFTLSGDSSPVALTTADFDGNGKIDVAVLTSNWNVMILLNDGAGHLHTAFTYAGPARPADLLNFALTTGDINGDTLPDVVVIFGAKGNDGTVTPYLSTHGGALTRGTTYTVGASGFPGAIADINHDGHGDVAIPTNTGVKFMLGSSSGQLTSGTSISDPKVSAVVLADFNKNGAIDLAVAGTLPLPSPSAPNTVSISPSFVNVYLGNNNGTFQAPAVYGTGNSPVSLIAGDFLGAGNTDLISFNAGDGSLSLFQNIGGGRFQAAQVTHSNNATGIVAGDFNRDGKQDIAVVNTANCKSPCKGTVTVFPGSGSNYFNAGVTYPIGMHGAAIATGDLNHDGISDLVVVNSIAGDAADTSVLLGNANGTFQAAHSYTFGSLSNDVVLSDMNKDGKLDLVTAGGVALGKGDGTFAARKPFPGFSFDPDLHFAVADVNGDGKLDAVVVDSADCNTHFQVLLGDGKGGLTPGQNVFDDVGQPVSSIVLARLRVGGAYDILYSYQGGCGAQVGGTTFSGVGGFIGDGHGTGTFTQEFTAVTGDRFSDLIAFGPVVVADFNADGKPDVGVGTIGHFVVARGNGNETFQPQQVFTVDNYLENFYDPTSATTTVVPSGIAYGDFLKDGKVDVMLTSGLGVARLYNATP